MSDTRRFDPENPGTTRRGRVKLGRRTRNRMAYADKVRTDENWQTIYFNQGVDTPDTLHYDV